MGKCHGSKCQSKLKQASFYDPGDGPGRYCKVCAVPGAVSRYQKEKEKAAKEKAASAASEKRKKEKGKRKEKKKEGREKRVFLSLVVLV